MRALFLLLMLMLMPAIVQGAPRPAGSQSTERPYAACAEPAPRHAVGARLPAGAQKLGDLPPASQYLAIDRRSGGCSTPIIVRTDIGTKRR
ncbi:MAG TPA: hypothetical protein VF649_03770 [Sphingomonas sp.]|jgi:hypothetical protein|uniref:hypothetical protein n=1 Tax=Sphingomonas sp. TaxID=28214 RepID=UPI002ED9BE1B